MMTKPIPALRDYYGTPDLPVIVEDFVPGRGWQRTGFRKRVSASWLRKERRLGVTHVAVELDGRTSDWRIVELLRSAAGKSR